MNILALIVALIAIALFGYEFLRTRSLVAAGLTMLTVAWVLQLVITTSDPVTI